MDEVKKVEPEKTDVPKESRKLIESWNKYIDSFRNVKDEGFTRDDVLALMSIVYDSGEKELADLRAERDRLKEEVKDSEQSVEDNFKNHQQKYDRLWVEHNKLKAENERLKKRVTGFTNINQWFTSELQRRWPSEEEINNKMDHYVYRDQLDSFKDAVEWLKSYLESNTKEG